MLEYIILSAQKKRGKLHLPGEKDRMKYMEDDGKLFIV